MRIVIYSVCTLFYWNVTSRFTTLLIYLLRCYDVYNICFFTARVFSPTYTTAFQFSRVNYTAGQTSGQLLIHNILLCPWTRIQQNFNIHFCLRCVYRMGRLKFNLIYSRYIDSGFALYIVYCRRKRIEWAGRAYMESGRKNYKTCHRCGNVVGKRPVGRPRTRLYVMSYWRHRWTYNEAS